MCNHHKDQKSKDKRHGSAIEHGQAHTKDHQTWSRRSFLRNLGVAGSMSMVLGNLPLTALGANPLSMALNNDNTDRILVLIRLKGGNDGMNMIIPLFDYGTYQANRPTIGVPQEQIISLNDSFGIPSYMESINSLWQDGQMKVVNSVGYPDQNLSHFRSSDIWASASDSDVEESSGWLGRYLDTQFPDFITDPPETPPAIQIGGFGNLLFNNADMVNLGMIVNDPDELFAIAQTGQLYDAADVPDCYYGEQLGFMRTIANSTFKYAEVIAEAYNNSTNAAEYEFSLGEQLALVARLIKGGLQTKLYMVSLDGFDTHAVQQESHPFLLFQIANAVKAFYEDLGAGGVAHRVLSMTFSEFGRRIEQNASGGTDHGAAAPVMLFGDGLNGNGFVGPNPDLHNLDQIGNLQYSTDFRQLYATLLENWLCLDGFLVDDIMGQPFTRLPELGLDCMATSTSSVSRGPEIQHKAMYGEGQIVIEYTIPESMPVNIQIYNILGQPVATLFDGYQMQGTHRVTFQSANSRLSGGHYVYSIRAGRKVFSQKIRVAR